MIVKARTSLKIAYCLVLLSAISPFGLAKSGWIALSTGGFGLMSFLGPLVFLALGLYRILIVARGPGVLDSPVPSGIELLLLNVGKFLLYVGGFVAVLNWVAGPLVHAFVQRRSDDGVEYFVVGLYLAMAGGIGLIGLFCFEFGRLRAFERKAIAFSNS